MNSKIFNSIGLGNIDIGYYFIIMLILIIILFVITIVQLVKTNKLNKKYEKFMQGSKAISLEDSIHNLFADINTIKHDTDTNKNDINTLQQKQIYNFQKLGIVRYDAFKGIGGKLSFSLAMLNEKNTGFMFNTVHSTEGCYCYTKSIKNGISNIDLSEEEQAALEVAISSKASNGKQKLQDNKKVISNKKISKVK